VKALEGNKVSLENVELRTKQLADLGVDKKDAENILFINGTNIFVNRCPTNIHDFEEIKPYLRAGFEMASNYSVLCSEPLSGVQFSLDEAAVQFHHARGRPNGQIPPTIKRVCYAAILSAKPTLMEPMHLARIKITKPYVTQAQELVKKCHGKIVEEIHSEKNCFVKAVIPVLDSGNFNTRISELSCGTGISNLSFYSWKNVERDDGVNSDLNNLVLKIRRVKDLQGRFPSFDSYNDEL